MCLSLVVRVVIVDGFVCSSLVVHAVVVGGSCASVFRYSFRLEGHTPFCSIHLLTLVELMVN